MDYGIQDLIDAMSQPWLGHDHGENKQTVYIASWHSRPLQPRRGSLRIAMVFTVAYLVYACWPRLWDKPFIYHIFMCAGSFSE